MNFPRRPTRRLIAAALLLGMVAIATGGPAHAQNLEPTAVAVVDVQHLLRDSLAGQAIERQMDEFRSGFGAEVNERETALREEERQLQEQASLLAPEVLQERRSQFEEKVIALQRDVRARQQALEQTYATGINQIRQVIVEIIQGLVESRGIELVLPRTGILVATRRLDITEDVLVELDKRLPSVSLTLEQGG